MVNQSGQPRKDDVVLGGGGGVPNSGVVLGGLEGVRRGLSSPIEAERVAALSAALQQGRRGLYLVVQALQDRSEAVRDAAYDLLHDRPEAIAQQAVQKFYTQQHYGRLQSALAGKRWKEADQETRIAMFRAIGLDPFGEPLPNPYRIAECPCRDLQIVNQLWVQYSRGRFGFSVQRSIWRPLHDLYWDKADVWGSFGDRVGWRSGLMFTDKRWKRYGEMTFSLNAPVGHLPFLGDGFGIVTLELLLDRLSECERPNEDGDRL
jgi:hypothetical protein